MAFVTTETLVVRNAGDSPATMKIYGTYLSSAGGTGGVIAPGYSNSSGTFTAASASNASAPNAASLGGRTILFCTLTPTLSDATAPGGVKSYNTTLDEDVFTIVTTADTGGTYVLECLDNGN